VGFNSGFKGLNFKVQYQFLTTLLKTPQLAEVLCAVYSILRKYFECAFTSIFQGL